MAKFKVGDRVKSTLNQTVDAYVVVKVDTKRRKLTVRPTGYVPDDLDSVSPTRIFVAA